MKDSHFIYVTKLYKTTIIYIVLTAINHGVTGVTAFLYDKPINFVESFFSYLRIDKVYHVFTIIIGICALIVGAHRDTYLTFLGECVFPSGILPKDNIIPENATVTKHVKVRPNSQVIYWAAEPTDNEKELTGPELAYGSYKNYGVVKASEFGNADLTVRSPQSYEIKKRLFKKTLKPHIHYRYTLSNGMFSRVETVFI